ncbi:MAG: beta-ketoacyl synthase N-terminal-like domain-containing protein [Mycobacteriales bacterium]
MVSTPGRIVVPRPGVPTLTALLRLRAGEGPDRPAVTIQAEGEEVTARLSYGELDRQARAVAAHLQRLGLAGERALMLYPSGPDFVVAFFGCLYAGLAAVPAYPPRSDKHLGRLLSVVQDADARVALAPAQLCDRLRREGGVDLFPGVTWVPTDRVVSAGGGADWQDPAVPAAELAFLQYTSGSTGAPKGVMLSHANLLHNSRLLAGAMAHTDRPAYLSWLPLFHDMGLIGMLLQAVYWHAECVVMPPAAFLQEPMRWLRAVSTHRATITGAPNFAYELCVRALGRERPGDLDLSCLRVAYDAAEPVRADTLARFAAAAAPHGFRRESLYVAYGLAENTVFVTGTEPGAGTRVRHVAAQALEQDRVRPAPAGAPGTRAVVECGHPREDQLVRIVAPDTGVPVPADRVGEIWLASPSVAGGYWRRPEETVATFGGTVPGEEPRRWLRTGDLGFLTPDGELCVTGRLKDLVILRGRNLYPQDLERTVEEAHPAFRPGCGAAFPVDEDGQERLVVVQEVRDGDAERLDVAAAGGAAAAALAEEHDAALETLVLIPARRLPKTSSGKVARRAARRRLAEGSLPVLGTWHRPAPRVPGAGGPAAGMSAVGPPVGGALGERVAALVAARLGLRPEELDPDEEFARYGVDSATAVELSGRLQRLVGRRLPATLLYDRPTLSALVRSLTGAPAAGRRAPSPAAGREPVAIIGLGCRFPGGPDPAAFWELLCRGGDAITEVPPDRWDAGALFDPELRRPGTASTRWGGFLDGITDFDPEFFGIAPGEAAGMDPQQRLLLEVAWEAVEDAGIAAGDLAGSPAGVFVGISNSDHARLLAGVPAALDVHHGTGTALSIAASRLSYLLDLRGPSVAVDTACSSSLVAVHQACESLLRGECSVALAGGVNVMLTPHLAAVFSRARMMSPQGRCRAFDEAADGYVRSEGCGVVVLKPLSAALAAGDRVLAVVRGSAVNSDGRSNGLTAPNGGAQREVVAAALAAAGVRPGEVDYVEAHGTGTPLGDPIEYAALADVLRPGRDPGRLCLLGSVKTNIGHLESAAGVAGLVKVVLALRHELIPAHLHLRRLNPYIDTAGSPLEIPRECRAWPAGERPRVAGISSFGFGGANAHVVVAEAPRLPVAAGAVAAGAVAAGTVAAGTVAAGTVAAGTVTAGAAGTDRYPYPLSARSPAALRELAGRHAARLGGQDAESFADLCATAATGRDPQPYRLAAVGAGRAEVRAALAAYASAGRPVAGSVAGRAGHGPPGLALLCSGQGAQHAGMGAELYRSEPVFRDVVDRCAVALAPRLEQDLRAVMFGDDEALLAQTRYTQPALFAYELAMAELWRSWGVRPTHLAGHSVGEYVAACLAGVFAPEDALALVATRARLMQELPAGGAMAAVRAGEAEVEAVLAAHPGSVALAAVNGPTDVVVSGAAGAVEEVLAELRAAGRAGRRLAVSHPFHSPLVEPMLADFRREVAAVPMRPPRLPVASNLTGALAGEELTEPDYWVQQARRPVRFADGARALAGAGCRLFLEVGPRAALAPLARTAAPVPDGRYPVSARPGRPARHVLLDALAELWTAGAPVDWAAVLHPHPRRRAGLPTYPFQRRRLWLPDTLRRPTGGPYATAGPGAAGHGHPLLGDRLPALAGEPHLHVWQRRLARDQVPVLDDHRIQGQVVAPGVTYLETALAAAGQLAGEVRYAAQDVRYLGVLAIPEGAARIVQVTLSGQPGGELVFRVHSRPAGATDGAGQDRPDRPDGWTLHATGLLTPTGRDPADRPGQRRLAAAGAGGGAR